MTTWSWRHQRGINGSDTWVSGSQSSHYIQNISEKSFNLNMNTMKLCRIKTLQKYYRKEMGWGKARERRGEGNTDDESVPEENIPTKEKKYFQNT